MTAKIGAKWQDFLTNSFFLNRHSQVSELGICCWLLSFPYSPADPPTKTLGDDNYNLEFL